MDSQPEPQLLSYPVAKLEYLSCIGSGQVQPEGPIFLDPTVRSQSLPYTRSIEKQEHLGSHIAWVGGANHHVDIFLLYDRSWRIEEV
jgi:hypothetical protein